MGVPRARKHVATAARRETAAAILGPAGQLQLTIARHHGTAKRPDRRHAFAWCPAVGDDIPGADYLIPADAARGGKIRQRFYRLKVGIGPAEQQQRSVQNPKLCTVDFRLHHTTLTRCDP